MSDVLNLRKEITAFNKSERFSAYSKVIINVTDDFYYEAGDNTGRTLTLSCPWGTQAMANDLLAKMRGFSYQPYTAEGAILDPASELGDGINVNGVYSGIYRMDTNFNSHCSTDISAPSDEEINYEYQYKSKQQREVKRKNSEIASQLTLHADQIQAEVTERKEQGEELRSAITVESDRITQEVKERKLETESLEADITEQGSLLDEESKERKKQYTELQSSLNIQAGKIEAETSERKSDFQSLNSKLSVQTDQIAAKVSKSGGDSSSFSWTLNDSSWTLKSNGSTVLKATKDGIEIKGKITATSGKIGGFTINSNYISYNSQTWKGTNSTGIYIGVSGIQLGTKFRVDNAGNLTAASGTFTGTVYAGKIKGGDDYGYLKGSAIAEGSIYGLRIAPSTLTLAKMNSGVSTSLGRADYSYNVCTGVKKANTLICYNLTASTKVSAGSLYVGGSSVSKKSKSFKDGNGTTQYIYYWGWA